MSRFTWQQEHNIITIKVPCLHPVINKPGYFDLYLSRSYVKFHLKSPKIFMDFDLLHDIDPQSSLSRTQAYKDHLEIVLAKGQAGVNWESLLNPDKVDAKNRREAGNAEVSEFMQRQREVAEKKKIEMDRLSVSEQMRIDGEKRKVLEDKMEQEKKEAIREMFASKPSSELFKERQDLPETRQQVVQSLKFTPKRDPNLPARESTINEPPIPNPLRPYGGPINETHPLFLKDKGDEFMKAADYHSAINAYSKALKSHPKFFEAFMNLGTCFVRTFEFDKAIENFSLAWENTTEDSDKAVCELRKGACLVWKGMISDGLLMIRKANEVLKEESVNQDIILIERRRESNVVKGLADRMYEEGKMTEAFEEYKGAAGFDESNEVVFANLAQVSLKLGKTDLSLEYCDKALGLITHNNSLKVKVLLRKANITNDISLIEQALMLDPYHPEALKLKSAFIEKQNQEQFDQIKAKADDLLKSSKPSEAQVIYRQLLSTCKDNDMKINLLTNISACQVLSNDFHGVVSTVQRAFKLNPKPSVRLRLFCRRAKAYGELGQLYSSQCDLREALKLDPDNQSIQRDLALLLSKS